MNSAYDNIINRRSIRRYLPNQISDAELELVLKAGVCAPTARNLQSPIIVAVRNADEINYLSELNAKVMGTDSDPFYGAPAVLIVLAKADSPFAVQDGSLVMGNLMNAANSLGLGSCWINRAREVFDSEAGKAWLLKHGIEEDYIGIGNCIIGYPDESPVMKPRKENYVYFVD